MGLQKEGFTIIPETVLNNNFCLLDTNFISELLKGVQHDSANEQKKLTRKILLEYCNPQKNIIVISITTIKEIYRRKDLFEKFINSFDKFLVLILKSFNDVLISSTKNKLEKEDIILIGGDFEFIGKVLNNPNLLNVLFKTNDGDLGENMINLWKKKQNNFSDEAVIKIQIIEKANKFKINKSDFIPGNYPSFFAYWYNQLFKFKNTINTYPLKKAKADANDVNALSVYIPFVDKVFTDKSQAEFVKQMREKGIANKNIEIFKLKGLEIVNCDSPKANPTPNNK